MILVHPTYRRVASIKNTLFLESAAKQLHLQLSAFKLVHYIAYSGFRGYCNDPKFSDR